MGDRRPLRQSGRRLTLGYVGRIGDETAPQNEADRLARQFIECFTAGDREAWLRMLAPNQVTRDHRPLVGVDTDGIDELANLYPRDRTTRGMASAVETIAVRGQRLVLLRWRAVSGSGREWESLHLNRWTVEGLNDLNLIFPTDQLAEALAKLDTLGRAEQG